MHRVIRTQDLSDDHAQVRFVSKAHVSNRSSLADFDLLRPPVLYLPNSPSSQSSPLCRRHSPRSEALEPPSQRQLRSQGQFVFVCACDRSPLSVADSDSFQLLLQVCDFGLARSVKTAEPNGTETGFMTVSGPFFFSTRSLP